MLYSQISCNLAAFGVESLRSLAEVPNMTRFRVEGQVVTWLTDKCEDTSWSNGKEDFASRRVLSRWHLGSTLVPVDLKIISKSGEPKVSIITANRFEVDFFIHLQVQSLHAQSHL